MTDIEIPLFKERGGKRTPKYRFFEMLPGVLSISAIVILVVLSLISPFWASVYVLVIVLFMFVRAGGIAFRTVQGRIMLRKTDKINWSKWLAELEDPAKFAKKRQGDLHSHKFGLRQHVLNLQHLSKSKEEFPRPSQIYHGVIIALYNESYDVLGPTLKTLYDGDYDPKRLFVVIAYEQRGGEDAKRTVASIKKAFKGKFADLLIVEHPDGLPDEIIGKGANITFAGKRFAEYIKKKGINSDDVIITTLDCDNRPSPKYFSYLTYEWIMTPNRQRAAFQPIALFTNNIWDAPAPMRVIAASNSFWNVISTMRPHMLRNFASHAQGLTALTDMNFWSTRTIVEDGHQYWRSYFHFNGDYEVIPIRIAVGQDAVLSNTYRKTLKAQFIQLRRWAYGVSDVAYVANNLLKKGSKVKFFAGWTRFFRLLEAHLTQACIAPIIAIGAWAPLYLNSEAAHRTIIANDLPLVVAKIQMIAIFGLMITVCVSITMLPSRPKRYKKSKGIMMVLQWVLMPINAIVYSSASAYTAQMRLLFGKYIEKFDVTEKAVKK
ncbi:MAG: glycosyltransferase family 2 protein [Candidatus Nomurabacteria bacterium]|jgi:cellulose synthase/poly-beta-1,6-N-acetylglucosamine synthase-like glycosyltransferase|nr:glycosyltransferase family 2 protein [Candidatus Nomurabacteria bacterium]